MGATTSPNHEKKPLPFRKLNWKEQYERRAKGMCFNCDEKYSTMQDCNGRFFILIVNNDDVDCEVSNNPYQMEKIAHKMVLSGDVSNLNSIAGQNNPRTLQEVGKFIGNELLILINSGSMHNFVQPTVIERLKIPTQTTTPFHVYIGNGDTLTLNGAPKLR